MSDSLSALGRAAYGGSVLDSIAHPAVVNPLAAYANALNVAKGVYDIRGAQAQQAIGNILQQATDENGNVDYPKANLLAAQAGPAVQMGMQTMLRNNSELRGQQQSQGLNANAAIVGAITGAQKASDADLPNAVADGIGRLIDQGVIPRNSGIAAALRLPTDPTQLRARLTQMQISLMPPDQQQQAIAGRLGTQTGPNGQTIGVVQQTVGPNAGAVSAPPQPGAPLGMTPDQLNSTVYLTDNRKTLPDGSPNPGYMQKIPYTVGDVLKTLHPGTPPGAVPQPGDTIGSGRYPPSGLRNPNAALPTPPIPPAAPAATGTPPLAQPSEADVETAKMAPAQFQTEANTGQAQQQQLATLSNMQSDIGRFTTGTGAERTLDFKRAIQSWAPPIAGALGIKPDQVASQESFDKLVNQIVTAQNPGSDQRMNVQMGATPHATQSPEGVDFIIRQLQGNSDYLQARAKLAQAYPNRSDYQGFQKSIADLDPRYFQYQRLNPEQKAAWFNGLPQKERDAFKQSYAKSQALIGGG